MKPLPHWIIRLQVFIQFSLLPVVALTSLYFVSFATIILISLSLYYISHPIWAVLCFALLLYLSTHSGKNFAWRFCCKLRNDENAWIIPIWTVVWITLGYSVSFCTNINDWNPIVILATELERMRNFLYYGALQTTQEILITSGALQKIQADRFCEWLRTINLILFAGAISFTLYAILDDIGDIREGIMVRWRRSRVSEQAVGQTQAQGLPGVPVAPSRPLTLGMYSIIEMIQHTIIVISDVLLHRAGR